MALTVRVKAEDEEQSIADLPAGDSSGTQEDISRAKIEADSEAATKVEDNKAKLKLLVNSKVKKKKNQANLNEQTILARLAPIGLDLFPVPVDPALASATATRTFFSAYFGGGVQKTFTRTGVTHKNPKKRNFACLKLDWNPHAPQDITETVLTCLESGKWLYVGEYRMGRSPRLTVDEWLSLKPQEKLAWTSGIAELDWGWDTRAKISLRKRLGRVPTEEELDIAAHAKEGCYDVTTDEIEHEFNVGHEYINIWTMKCIAYDGEFPLTIADNFEEFDAEEKAKRVEKRGMEAERVRKRRKTGAGTVAEVKKERKAKEEEEEDIGMPDPKARRPRGKKMTPSSGKAKKEEEETETLVSPKVKASRKKTSSSPVKNRKRKRAELDYSDSESEVNAQDESDADYTPRRSARR
ncbi:hypothetical protein CPB85DRAFT_1249075 [Mucidula mucida]|nr:hypothetical protein CPB85DRAFT_1249075 [Mucidula mucida]